MEQGGKIVYVAWEFASLGDLRKENAMNINKTDTYENLFREFSFSHLVLEITVKDASETVQWAIDYLEVDLGGSLA